VKDPFKQGALTLGEFRNTFGEPTVAFQRE
jgi:hypothetical protein